MLKSQKMHGITNDFLYAVGRVSSFFRNPKTGKETKLEGTGFYIKKNEKIFFITNRHVLDLKFSNPSDESILANVTIDERKYNSTKNTVEVEQLSLSSINLRYAADSLDDIACVFNIRVNKTINLNTIDYSMLANTNVIQHELNVCDRVVSIGFPIYTYDHLNDNPVLRSGVISSDPRLCYSFNDKYIGHTMAYESYSTEGGSGSPIFACQKGFKVGKGLTAPSDFFRQVYLIGIQSKIVNLYKKMGENSIVKHQQMSILYKSDKIIELIDMCDNL